MRASYFDPDQIQLQHQTLTQDPNSGQQVASWTTYATVWAQKPTTPVPSLAIDPALEQTREYNVAAQITAEATRTFILRWRTDVLQTDRIVDAGVNFNIRQIAEIPRRRGLRIVATAPVN